MHRTLLKFGVSALAMFLMCACAQMTRHSNTLVFGTNTTVGLGIGNDATSTPSIEIGFRRQEVALVPVLANTHYADETRSKLLLPCPLPETINAANAEALATILDACHFRATIKGHERDSYSVLASFGTRTTAEAGKGTVAIAQYFATGVAAQQLAKTGGANVIRAGDDAGEIAKSTAMAQASMQEIESNNEKLATAYRESILLWVRGASAENITQSAQSDEAQRRQLVGDYIQEQFDADSNTGLVWLYGASTQQLEAIKEHFEIPIYAENVRHELLSKLFESENRSRLGQEDQENSAVGKIVSCTNDEAKFDRAKSIIKSNMNEFDSDEIDSFFSSIEKPHIKNEADVTNWINSTSSESEDDRDQLAKIIIYYIKEIPFNSIIDEICSDT